MIRRRPTPRYSRTDGAGIGCGVLIALAVIAVIVVSIVGYTTVTEHTGCVVQGKDRTAGQRGTGSDARVYTSCGTFQVADDPFRGRFDSADTYGQLREGQAYDITAAGWRIPILSRFPNILDARAITP